MLPLERLELHGVSSPTMMRRLPAVNLQFVPLSTLGSPKELLDAWKHPYLHLFLLPVDDTTQQQNKARLQAWLESLAGRKGQWGLVLMVTGAMVPTTGKPPSVDLAAGGKLVRSAVLRLGSPGPELAEALRLACASAFHDQAMALEEEVRRLEARRPFPGWNFFTYLVCKENLAFHYGRVGLHEEALQQYDQLEATLSEVENAADGQITANSVDDTAPYFQTRPFAEWTEPEVRKAIYENTMTLPSVRAYLFARQSFLILRLGLASEFLARGRLFISRQVKGNGDDCKKWSFRTALALLSLSSPSPGELCGEDLQRTELYIVAKHNLELLAESRITAFARKHSLSVIPVSEEGSCRDLPEDIGKWQLDEILRDPRIFDYAYRQLVDQAIKGCARLNLHRKLIGLRRDHVALNMYRPFPK